MQHKGDRMKKDHQVKSNLFYKRKRKSSARNDVKRFKKKKKPEVYISIGEERTKGYLEQFGVSYEREKKFDWLINRKGNNLRFDFWLPKYSAAIEFDGKYHYTNYRQKVNDKQKNAVCKKQKVPLLRIPYFHSDKMESIISDFIKSLEKSHQEKSSLSSEENPDKH